MKKIHHYLEAHVPWYKEWHESAGHELIQYGTALLFAAFLFATVSSYHATASLAKMQIAVLSANALQALPAAPKNLPSTFSAPAVPDTIDTDAPDVFLTSPAASATVLRNSAVLVSAAASDDVGVAKVEFYINGGLLCADTESPFTCAWMVPGVPDARYALYAKAYDGSGNNKYSYTQYAFASH
ncbi:MAG: Ig-like domain-containing protein [bacterium]